VKVLTQDQKSIVDHGHAGLLHLLKAIYAVLDAVRRCLIVLFVGHQQHIGVDYCLHLFCVSLDMMF